MAKLVATKELMHPSTKDGELPGIHERRRTRKAAQSPEPEPEPAVEESPEPLTVVADLPEDAENTPGVDQEPEEKPAAVNAAPAKTASKRPAKKATAKKSASTAKKTAPAPAGENDDDLESLDGRPGRLWDISDGKDLPEGWGRIALERVHRASRRFRADRRNTILPDNLYDACNTFIYEEAKDGGLPLTLSNLAEAAYEQIPVDDVAGINRLLDGLPDYYFERNLATRPRTFQLLEPTVEHMQNLARMLRAKGFTGKTGLVQAAALRQLLLDLGVHVD